MNKQTDKFLEDFMKVRFGKYSISKILKKYNINKKTYEKYKRRFVKEYGVDPRFLYSDQTIMNDSELKSYCKDENLSKSPNQLIKDIKNITKEQENALQVKGTSTLYDSEGNIKMQWVKTDINKEAYLEGMKSAISKLCEGLKPSEEIKLSNREELEEDLMTLIPIPDLHLGLEIEPERVSHNFKWNTDIAVKYYTEAISYVLDKSPKSKELVLVDLGDILHSPNNGNRTPNSGHVLDVSGSAEKNMLTLFNIMIETIQKALTKFEKVYFYSVPGNHNMDISLSLKCVLKNYFRNEERVIIDIDKYNNIYYHGFGDTLLSFTHGDEIKVDKIESVMFADNLDTISKYKKFDAFFGHIHHNSQKQKGLVNARSLKNIIPCDKWASSVGFRNNDVGYMQAFIYHKNSGEISSITYRPM